MSSTQKERKRRKYYRDALQFIRPVAEYAYEHGWGNLAVRMFDAATVYIEVERASLSGRLYVVISDDRGNQAAFTNQFDAAETLADYMLDLRCRLRKVA